MGCEANLLHDRTITVHLDEPHPWQEVSHKPLWHVLVYTDGRGGTASIHLPRGTKEVEVVVPKGCLTVFCAYPLSSCYPYGGFSLPGGSDQIVLRQADGALARLLLDAYQHNPEAVEYINAARLSTKIGDVSLCDGNALAVSLLNGTGVPPDLHYYEKQTVVLDTIPAGYWVPERVSQRPFWSQWGKDVTLSLEGGLQRFLSREENLCLSLYVDQENGTCTSSLSKAPQW